MDDVKPNPTEPVIRTAVSRGYRISYEDAGAGSAIVLVNGLTGTAAEWRELGYVDGLSASHRVLSVDSLGHGRSAKPHNPDAYRSPDVASDIVAAMDAGGVDRAALWGYSRGASLVSMIAIEFPDRVAALVVGGGPGTDPPDPHIPEWADALYRGDWDGFWSAFGEVSEYDRRQMQANDPKAIGAADIGSRRSKYVLDLGRAIAPALVYCGGGDEPQALQPTAAALGVELRIVGMADHFTTFTDAEGIVPMVLSHLQRVDW